MAGSEAVIEIRQLSQLDEFAEVLRLQQVIWGFADVELLPLRFLVVVSKVGGHVFGAYDVGLTPPAMVGFCFAIPGIKPPGQPYLHSHMLGVLPAYHNAGIGRRLKLRQREEALSRNIQLIEWTFDPMELKNAFLNIERLGAIVRRYSENQYGVTNSPLHGGLPTDRCTAEWWLDSPRVRATLAGEKVEHRGDHGRAGRRRGPVAPVDLRRRIRLHLPPARRDGRARRRDRRRDPAAARGRGGRARADRGVRRRGLVRARAPRHPGACGDRVPRRRLRGHRGGDRQRVLGSAGRRRRPRGPGRRPQRPVAAGRQSAPRSCAPRCSTIRAWRTSSVRHSAC